MTAEEKRLRELQSQLFSLRHEFSESTEESRQIELREQIETIQIQIDDAQRFLTNKPQTII